MLKLPPFLKHFAKILIYLSQPGNVLHIASRGIQFLSDVTFKHGNF